MYVHTLCMRIHVQMYGMICVHMYLGYIMCVFLFYFKRPRANNVASTRGNGGTLGKPFPYILYIIYIYLYIYGGLLLILHIKYWSAYLYVVIYAQAYTI